MKHRFITIGRQYGSGGHKIGQLIADKLKIPYYDNELIILAAQRGEVDEKHFSKFDEKKNNPYLYEINYKGNDNVKKGESISDTLYQLQTDVILDIAEKQDAVIVGRCADYILKNADFPTISVFIAAPENQRIQRLMALEGLDEKAVSSLIKKKDKIRKAYYESHTGKIWGSPESYDVYYTVTDMTKLNQVADEIIEMYLEGK